MRWPIERANKMPKTTQRKIVTQRREMNDFQLEMEISMKQNGLTLMEALVDYSQKKGIEIELVAKLIGPDLKSKLKDEAAGLHFLRHKNGKVIRPKDHDSED